MASNGESVLTIVLKEIPENPELGLAWNALAMQMERPEVFFTHEWALAAVHSRAKNLFPLLFLMYESDRLLGVAALATDQQEGSRAFFLTGSTADYCDILSAPTNRNRVLLAVLQEVSKLGIRDLILANVPADSSTLGNVPLVSSSCRFHFTSRAAYICGIVEFGEAEQRKKLLETVARKDREKRALRKLAALGPVRVTHLTTAESVNLSLDSIISAQVTRFLVSDRASPLLSPERRLFLKALTELLGRAGWLKVSELQVSGHSIAWNYGFRFADSWFWYLPTFEIKREDASPGSCLLRLLVEEGCVDPSLGRIDLGLGGEPYKTRFANAERQTCHVQLSRSMRKHMASVGRKLLISQITRYPRFEATLRKSRNIGRIFVDRVNERGLFTTIGGYLGRVAHAVASRDEVLLFEYRGTITTNTLGLQLASLTWSDLAKAAIANAGDVSTLRYFMRCAKRLLHSATSGFLLRDREGRLLHFLWLDNCASFHLSEIDHQLEVSLPGAMMIFDCWTPAAYRGKGYYATAIRLLACNLMMNGKTAWIFSASRNFPSLRGILKADFEYQFSLIRHRVFGFSKVTRCETTKGSPNETRR
jgi:CelD/BcsL family acetyltransferase involved in cellulose biosynthesis